jgi:ketosteroid isomerase-like protein
VSTDAHRADVVAIEALVARQFASLSWAPGKPPDWEAFAADFYPDAALYPAARPAKRQTVEAFVERMKGLAATSLCSFNETVLGTEVRVFGNVAVALAACEIIENEAGVSRGVEALLLAKEEGRWRIVSQAWDNESESKPIPARLIDRKASG